MWCVWHVRGEAGLLDTARETASDRHAQSLSTRPLQGMGTCVYAIDRRRRGWEMLVDEGLQLRLNAARSYVKILTDGNVT
eukprot:404597-Hanusia_phi.AAC.1